MSDNKQPEPVDGTESTSRRAFLKSVGVLGAGAAGASILAACGDGDDDNVAAESDATDTSSGDDTTTSTAAASSDETSAPGGSLEGKTVRIGAIEGFQADSIKEAFKGFEEETGATVEWLLFTGGSGVELIQQLSPQFVAERSEYDLILISDEATPAFVEAGWLAPLTEVYDEVIDDFPEAMRIYTDTWSTKDGEVLRLPIQFSMSLFWGRQDVMDDLGISVPTTWDEILELGPVAKENGMWVYADGVVKPALASMQGFFLSVQNGADPFAFDDGVREVFEFVNTLMEQDYFPSEAVSWDYNALNAAYTTDQVLTMRQWTGFDFQQIAPDWYAPEKVTIFTPPSGPSGSPATFSGGWGLSMPQAAEEKEGAIALARWAMAPENAGALAKAHPAWVTPRTSTVEQVSAEESPFLHVMVDYIDQGVVRPRPHHVKVNEAQEVFDTAFNGYLSGQFSLDEALQLGQDRMAAL